MTKRIISGCIANDQMDKHNEKFDLAGCDVSKLLGSDITWSDFKTVLGIITKVEVRLDGIYIEGELFSEVDTNGLLTGNRFSLLCQESYCKKMATF